MDTIKSLWEKIKHFLTTYERLLYTILFGLSIVFLLSMIWYRYITTNNLNAKWSFLWQTSVHNLDRLWQEESLKDVYPLWKDIDQMINFQNDLIESIVKNEDQRRRLSIPFENFLHMYYLPSINIRKDPFTDQIDTSLIGNKYIEHNKYSDINLIHEWTEFFKDVGVVDAYNTITDVKVGNLTSASDQQYFSIPVTVDFETPDKRSFLLLVNKLSLTAYLQNISLINEFMYYVRETIKEQKEDMITQHRTNESIKNTNPDLHDDKIIWYLLYNWIDGTIDNELITREVLLKAIYKTVWCTNEPLEECLYRFRDKMRSIPYLAYGVGRSQTDMVQWFKFFFNNMPPLLSIQSFSFEEKNQRWSNKNEWWFKWSISINVYGKDVDPNEVRVIAQDLGNLCFVSKESMSVAIATMRTEKVINDLGRQTLDTNRSIALSQIVSFINTVSSEYETLANHRKVVRLFELYRTLKENNICDIIDTTSDTNSMLDQWFEPVVFEDDLINTVEYDLSDNDLWTGNILWDEQSDWIVEIPINRTIGDGNSKRDQELANELDLIQ